MEETLHTKSTYKLDFKGNGGAFFGIIIVNWLLTVLTLGIYYPWAKAKTLQFVFGQTTLNNDAFAFHGTGKEMFKGFIKAIALFFCFGLVMALFIYLNMPGIGLLLFYLGLIAIMPIAIHGSYRYRTSRTSWRGIRFGYRGDRKEFIGLFFKWIFFTVITLGIYGPWMVINMRNYIISNIRFGDAQFDYEGDGGDYFILNLKGYLLTIFTFGIYLFWWQKDIFNYYVDHLSLHKGKQQIGFSSTAKGGDFAGLFILNILILIFTLGLGYAWVVTRTLSFMFEHMELEGDLDLNSLHQTEANFKDATGEDISDFLDLDFIV